MRCAGRVLDPHPRVDLVAARAEGERLADAQAVIAFEARVREYIVKPYRLRGMFFTPEVAQVFRARMEYREFKAGDTLRPAEGIALRTAPLNHPDGATGYRVEYRGRSVCYLTDTEHVPGAPDRNILELITGADLVIYDSMYTDAEYAKSYVGWGHSTWQEAIRLAKLARVRKLVLFHHDPEHDDAKLDAIGREAEAQLPGTLLAREGMVLEP